MAAPSNPFSPIDSTPQQCGTNKHNNIAVHSIGREKYAILRDITKLRASPQIRSEALASKMQENCHTLVYNLICSNPTWAIDSLVKYAMMQYKDYGVTHQIISDCIHDWIMAK